MKDILVDYINHYNNRNLTSDTLLFGDPSEVDEFGMIKVGLSFSTITGWQTNENAYLTYKRQDIQSAVPDSVFVVHSNDYTLNGVITAIFNQYGFYLDEGHYQIVETDASGTVLVVIDETAEERYFKIEINDTHLLLEGEILVHVVPSIELLDTSISRLIDIRSYYATVNEGPYPTELYTKPFVFNAELDEGSVLFNVDTTDLKLDVIATVLSRVSRDDWVVSDTPSAFNLKNASLIYNGLVSDDYPGTDVEYPYVLVIELSSEYCSNLIGSLIINYYNNDDLTPFPIFF